MTKRELQRRERKYQHQKRQQQNARVRQAVKDFQNERLTSATRKEVEALMKTRF